MRSRFVIAGVLLLMAAGTQPGWASDDVEFSAATAYPAATFSSGLGAGAISAADFNRDRRRDLVVSNCGGGGPSVLLNRGGGAFAAPRVVPTDTDACTVGAADVNADGKPDIAAASYASGNVTVLLGRGDGTFAKAGQYRSGNAPMQLAFADFNGDGRIDIASMNNSPGSVRMLFGTGGGKFRDGGDTPVANQAISMVRADFDRDGAPDLAVTEVAPMRADVLPGELKVLRNTGDGSFEPPVTYPVGGSPEYVAAGDLDHDGRVDLVVGNAIWNNDLSILYGTGGGRFAPEQRLQTDDMGIRVANGGLDFAPGVQLADFDADGHLDIAVIQTGSGKVVILQGDGRRHFRPAGQHYTATLPESFLATDLTGDGLPDLAVPGNLPVDGFLPLLGTRVSVLVNESSR